MIASLAAVGLAPGLGSTTSSRPAPIIDDESTDAADTQTGVMVFDGPQPVIDATKPHTAIIQTNKGPIEIQLSTDAPQAVNSFAYLVAENFYDGLEFFWIMPGFDVQAGDPTCKPSDDFTCTGTGGPGYALSKEGDTTLADKWTVIAPTTAGGDQVHGSQFVITLKDQLEFEGTVLGQVIDGRDILETLEHRVPCSVAQTDDCDEDPDPTSALIIEEVIVKDA